MYKRQLEEGDTSPRARLNLYVELAASLGSQAYELVAADGASSADVIAPILDRLVNAVMRARAADPAVSYTHLDVYKSQELAPQSNSGLMAGAGPDLTSYDLSLIHI